MFEKKWIQSIVSKFSVSPANNSKTFSVQIFMSFTDVGSKFVFGASYTDHLFVFKVCHTPAGCAQTQTDE